MKQLKQSFCTWAIICVGYLATENVRACELTIDSVTTSNLTVLGTVSGNVGDLFSPTLGVSILGGSNSVLGSGTAIAIQDATDFQPGLLTAADHVAFSAKLTPTEVTNAILNLTDTMPQIVLQNLTVFVATTGNDSTNTGLSAQSPFRTIQHAVDVVTTYWEPAAGVVVTIQVTNGTYAGAQLRRGNGPGSFRVVGNSSSPSSVVVTNMSSGTAAFYATESAAWGVDGFTVQNATYGIWAFRGALISFANAVFSTGLNVHVVAQEGGHVRASSNYTVSGGGNCHLYAITGGSISISTQTITVTGTPAFAWQFAQAYTGGIIDAYSCTFSGSATGVRYLAGMNGVIFINRNPSGVNLFPGNSAGFTEFGGQYH